MNAHAQHTAKSFTAASALGIGPVQTLVYRSTAKSALNTTAIHALLKGARSRNSRESITGLLVYHGEYFFQWLEGPSTGLARVWDVIQRDPQHEDIRVLGEYQLPMRLFSQWSMQYAACAPLVPAALDATRLLDAQTQHALLQPPTQVPQLLAQLADRTAAPSLEPLAQLIEQVVLPLLTQRSFGLDRHANTQAWQLNQARQVAQLALRRDPSACWRMLEQASNRGLATSALYSQLLEPAARHLGDLWLQDRCSQIDITLALCRLLTMVHMIGGPAATIAQPNGRRILVAPLPGEQHALGSTITAELFWRAGWAVQYEYMSSADELAHIARHGEFDVCDISTSCALSRHDALAHWRKTIAAVRHACAKKICVLAGGRLLHARPELGASLDADACYESACSVVRLATNALAVEQRSADTDHP